MPRPRTLLATSALALAAAVCSTAAVPASASASTLKPSATATSTPTIVIGSENFTTGSLEYNREVGVVFTTPAQVLAVQTAIKSDVATGRSMNGVEILT